MKYISPTVVDYGDVAQLTACQNSLNIADACIANGQPLGIQNSSGVCPTGTQDVGGVCVPLP